MRNAIPGADDFYAGEQGVMAKKPGVEAAIPGCEMTGRRGLRVVCGQALGGQHQGRSLYH